MQYEAKTPKEYLDHLENDWKKKKLEEIREMIKSHGSRLIEGIEYKMLCFGNGKKNIFHLATQRNYVSLYVGNIHKIKNSLELLNDFDKGKGSIRVKKSNELSKSNLEEFIAATLNLWKEGGNTNC